MSGRCLPEVSRTSYRRWYSGPSDPGVYVPSQHTAPCYGFHPQRCNQWYPSEAAKYAAMYNGTYVCDMTYAYPCIDRMPSYPLSEPCQ